MIASLPHALRDGEGLSERLAGRRPAVFLDYDGTLTPIVDRPEDAVLSETMREAVRRLASRCPVCVVSGRDRPVVQELMGIDDLIVAGSHGFDIWSPHGGELQRDVGARAREPLREATQRLRDGTEEIAGALVEPKRSSVAVHYRLVADAERPAITALVESILADNPDTLRVTPGKLVYEIQPRIEWDKGRAVLYLLEALGLDGPDVLPLYFGDDITDEDAFAALADRGIGILVGRPDDPEMAGRETRADYIVSSPDEVGELLERLAT